jgi:hypothetical protein
LNAFPPFFPGFSHAEVMEGVLGFDYLQGSFLRTSRERANAPLALTLAGLLEFGLTEIVTRLLCLTDLSGANRLDLIIQTVSYAYVDTA